MTGDDPLLHRVGGVLGVGWTTTLLGYVSSVLGYSTELVARLGTEPVSLLYAGVVLLLATLGLDRFAGRDTGDEADGA